MAFYFQFLNGFSHTVVNTGGIVLALYTFNSLTDSHLLIRNIKDELIEVIFQFLNGFSPSRCYK